MSRETRRFSAIYSHLASIQADFGRADKEVRHLRKKLNAERRAYASCRILLAQREAYIEQLSEANRNLSRRAVWFSETVPMTCAELAGRN